MESYARDLPWLRLVFLCGRDLPTERWTGPLGRLSVPVLQALVPDYHDREIMVCGPDGYMATVRSLLTQLDYPLAHHHEEQFSFDPPPVDPTAAPEAPSTPGSTAAPAATASTTVPADPPVTTGGSTTTGAVDPGFTTTEATGEIPYTRTVVGPADADTTNWLTEEEPTADVAAEEEATSAGEGQGASSAGGEDAGTAVATHTIEFAKSGVSVECPADRTVLDAGREAGLRLPSACGQGLCGTCTVSLLAGEVDLRHNGGIRPKEVAAGKTLMCCSKPLGDLRVDA
ncbi:flavin reductase family protein [Brevibacterium litoralis]|uniref:flavin reductase family protein n=1 Tax=Brevibacterium litoralis TaxID=3138935 RepID=UPI0032EAA5DD